jgi:hypothetical protein
MQFTRRHGLNTPKLIEETGVDGIELNFYAVPKDTDSWAEKLEGQTN